MEKVFSVDNYGTVDIKERIVFERNTGDQCDPHVIVLSYETFLILLREIDQLKYDIYDLKNR